MAMVIGRRLRQVRQTQGFSMQEIANKVDISVATLSRIENDKQALDLELFLTLAKALKQQPSELLGSASATDGADSLFQRISSLDMQERMRLWKQLTRNVRTRKEAPRAEQRQLAGRVDELLAHLDLLRAEIDSVSRRLKKS